MHHYPRNIGDWMTATAHLSDVEECIYSRMTDQYYARELPLPLEMVSVCRLVRATTPAAKRAVPVILGEFFTEQPDGWHQKRCDEEIAKYREKSAKARASAYAGVSERSANAQRTLSERSPDIQANAELNKKQETEPLTKEGQKHTPARKRAVPLPPDFTISDAVREWAMEKGHGSLLEHLEAFVGRAKAKGYTYLDWDQAFMNAIREDWAGLTKIKAAAHPNDKRAKVAAEMYAHRKERDERSIDGTAERLD